MKPPIITRALFFAAEYEPGGKIAVSPRPFSSLTLRESGKISVESEDACFLSSAGSLTYIPAGCGYSTEILAPGKMQILHFFTAPESPRFAERPTVSAHGADSTFLHLFARAEAHYAEHGCDLSVMSAAYELLSLAEPILLRAPPEPSPRMRMLREYIEGRLADPELRVSDLAVISGVSEVCLRREFKACFGETPIGYIKRRRISLARRLLSTGFYSVTEVAMRSGFDSISYFSAEFRRITGKTPIAYRDQYGKL